MKLFPATAHEQLFRLLLRLYPAPFRRAYGEEMVELFRRRLADRQTGERTGTVMGLWVRVVGDVVRTTTGEWLGWEAVSDHPVRERSTEEREVGMRNVIQELRDATRQLVRAPLFSLAAIAIVTLGIGANTAAFTIVNTFLFRPPPWEDPERVVNVYQDSDDGDPNSTSFPAYRDMATFDDVFEAVAASSSFTVTWETDEGPLPAAAEFVSSSYLQVFGLRPHMGRWFDEEHDWVGSGAYAVVSHRTWRTKMGADPGIVGRVLRFNGQPVTVLGVGPESFNGNVGVSVTDFWLSISSTVLNGSFQVANLDRRMDHWYDVKARLAPEVTVAQAQAAMDALATRLATEFPELNEGRDITVFAYGDVRLHPDVDAGLLPAAGVLLGVVGLVLLLACSNLANLLLVRGLSRAPEVAVRRALGASGARVARLFLLEALLLSSVGGVVGILAARWVVSLVPLLPIPLPLSGDVDLTMDHRVFLFTLFLVLVTGGLFGLVPALRSASADVSSALREDGRSASPGRRVSFFRNTMVVVQVAASIVLVIGSGLLLRTLANLQSADPGVDAERVAFLATSVTQAGFSAEEGAVVFEEVRERFEALPGVTHASLATRLPVQDRGGSSTTVIEGYDPPSGTGSVELIYSAVGPEYFETMGVPVLEGRAFTPQDGGDTAPVAIMNATAARRYWGGTSPIGRRIRPQSAPDFWIEVVGVVEDVRIRAMTESPTPMFYRPTSQWGLGSAYFVVRTDGDPATLAATLRSELRELRPALAINELGTLESHLRDGLAPSRIAAMVLGVFSALALLLASLGIYAVVSFAVARRSSELGIRIALGAARGKVLMMVLREIMVTVAIGLGVGMSVAALAAVQLEGVLFGMRGLDPTAFTGGALLLVLVAGFAAYLPARRAAVADPVVALRTR